MEIYFYQAECGDAARIHYKGNDGKEHNILIDSGYERTFGQVIKDEIAKAGHIDAWVISHIHDDHIGGAVAYIAAMKRKEIDIPVHEWLYNAPRKSQKSIAGIDPISNIKSIGQGDTLWEFLCQSGHQPKSDTTANSRPRDFFGLKVEFLTPSTAKLNKLRKKYGDGSVPLEKEENFEISSAKGVAQNDYQTLLMDFDLKKWKQDQNVDNGSSISVLTELNGSRVLWLSDAHPKDIVSGLNRLGFTKDKPLVCDYVKVTHHGSKGNNSNELYDIVRCENYIFSVNGENRHALPNKDSIARILRNSHRDVVRQPYNLYLTYDNPTLQSIFSNENPQIYKQLNFTVSFNKNKFIKFPSI